MVGSKSVYYCALNYSGVNYYGDNYYGDLGDLGDRLSEVIVDGIFMELVFILFLVSLSSLASSKTRLIFNYRFFIRFLDGPRLRLELRRVSIILIRLDKGFIFVF